jgi:hypothetical protein
LAKPRTVALPDYPPNLLKPGFADSLDMAINQQKVRADEWQAAGNTGPVPPEPDRFEQLLDSLAEHYRLEGRFSDLPPPKPGPIPTPGDILYFPNKELRLWMGLAWGLMRDFVPAFGDKKPGPGKPKQKHTQRQALFPYAHEARFVQIVRALRDLLDKKEMPVTNQAAYRQLIRILRSNPAPRWLYGHLKEPNAFAQVWKSVPDGVKDDPDSYFPLHMPQWDFPKELHLEVVDAGRGRSILAMQHMAAYLKRKSMERLFEILPPVPAALPVVV